MPSAVARRTAADGGGGPARSGRLVDRGGGVGLVVGDGARRRLDLAMAAARGLRVDDAGDVDEGAQATSRPVASGDVSRSGASTPGR